MLTQCSSGCTHAQTASYNLEPKCPNNTLNLVLALTLSKVAPGARAKRRTVRRIEVRAPHRSLALDTRRARRELALAPRRPNTLSPTAPSFTPPHPNPPTRPARPTPPPTPRTPPPTLHLPEEVAVECILTEQVAVERGSYRCVERGGVADPESAKPRWGGGAAARAE